MSYLREIESPDDLKKLSTEELTQLCDELRSFMIDSCADNPGHIGASLGSVEITVALHYLYNAPYDKIVWDVGHQAYAHKILTGRRDNFHTNRTYGGISGFPKMSESPYDAFGVGHSSTSISAALGMAVAAEERGENRKVVAVIGDGALTGGLAYEGLNHAGDLKRDILVIVNDNNISIDPNVGALHRYLTKITTSHLYNETKEKVWRLVKSGKIRALFTKLTSSTKMALFGKSCFFESLGFRYFGAVDGHDLPLLIKRIGDLQEIPGPKILHVVTKKGKGFLPAESDQTVWHAPGQFDKLTGEIKGSKEAKASRYQDVFGETLLSLAKKNPNIYGITPAMPTGSSMNILMKALPHRAFDVGIAEQHAVTFSAGLAAEGLLPYCNIYSSFMQRAYDSVIHDVAVQDLKVIFCLDRGGLVGEDGATHHGVFDLAAFRTIPNLTLFSPLNEAELRDILHSVQWEPYRSTIIRYPRGRGEGVEWRGEAQKIEYGKAQLLREGEGVAVLTIGPVGNRAAEAIERAVEEGLNPLHYNMRFLKPIDQEALNHVVESSSHIITVEDGSLIGGLYSAVSEFVAAKGISKEITVEGLGVPDRFIDQGRVAQLHKECRIDSDSIYSALLLKRNYLKTI